MSYAANLHNRALERTTASGPIKVGSIGAGKFGSMFLSQVPKTSGSGAIRRDVGDRGNRDGRARRGGPAGRRILEEFFSYLNRQT